MFGSYSDRYPGTKPGCFGHTRVGTRVPNLIVFRTRVGTRGRKLVAFSYSGTYSGTTPRFIWSYSGRYPGIKPGCFGHTRIGHWGFRPGCFGHTRVGAREPNLVVLAILDRVLGYQTWLLRYSYAYAGRYSSIKHACFGRTRVGTRVQTTRALYPLDFCVWPAGERSRAPGAACGGRGRRAGAVKKVPSIFRTCVRTYVRGCGRSGGRAGKERDRGLPACPRGKRSIRLSRKRGGESVRSGS